MAQVQAHCGREHPPSLPDAIQDLCSRLAAQLNSLLIDNNIVADVRSLKERCHAEGPRVWTQALASMPPVVRSIVLAITRTKEIPAASRPRIKKFCEIFKIEQAEFDEFFYGASAYGFFEALTKAAYAVLDQVPTLDWAELSGALGHQRDKRIRNAKSDDIPLWKPGDVKNAERQLLGWTEEEIDRDSKKRRRQRGPNPPLGLGQRPDTSPSSPYPEHGRAPSASATEQDGRQDWVSSSGVSPSRSPEAKRRRQYFSPQFEFEGLDVFEGPEFCLSDLLPVDSPSDSPATGPPAPLLLLMPPPPLPSNPVPVNSPSYRPSPASLPPRPSQVPNPPPPPPPPPPPGSSSLPPSWQAGLADNDKESLLSATGWLTGVTMNMAFDAITSATTPRVFPVSTDVLTTACKAANHPAYADKLRDQDMLILPVHICGNHWCLASVDRTIKVAAVYDSMASRGHEVAAERVIVNFLTEFLREDAGLWEVTPTPSPQQADRASCGVFVIATAIHLLSGRPLPTEPYHTGMWRLVLACLVAPERAQDRAIWPFTPGEDAQSVSVAAPPDFAALSSRFLSGACTPAQALALAAAIHRATGYGLSRMTNAFRQRRSVRSELKTLETLVTKVRGTSDRWPLARLVVERWDARVGRALADATASVAYVRAQLEVIEGRAGEV
ncbi:hypothetical protein QBC39DRAFT_375355 [Podospora conica]|nr:hypothetical protein QBC39DRAFT_375355 [Schizothecium conicum]